jgi:hypothetical protein
VLERLPTRESPIADRERDRLEALAKQLLEAEELNRETVLSVLGARSIQPPWGNPPGPSIA